MKEGQWYALGSVFLMASVLFGIFILGPIRNFASAYSLLANPMGGLSGEELIAANIQDAMYTSLSWICYIIGFIFFIAVVACFVCGWLEKDGER